MLRRAIFYKGPACVSILILFAAVASFAQTPMRLDGSADTSEYRKLVDKAKSGDLTIDFVKLREAYLDWTLDECNISDAPKREDMVKAFETKDFAKAVSLAQVVLDYEYVNRGLHLAVANAYKEVGNAEKSKFHSDVADKLVKAMLASGDGKSAKTAFKVLSIREEYVIMREMGYQVSSQALAMDKEFGAMDILSGKTADGKEGSFYFAIDKVWVGSTASKPCKNKVKK